jgi:hypothetical protein
MANSIPVASANLAGVPNVGQVLKHDGSTCRDVLDNPFRKHVVSIPVEKGLYQGVRVFSKY